MSDYQGNIVIKNPATPTGPSTYGRAPGMWKLNEVAYWIKQGVWPNANIVPDQYFPYVSLLLSTTSLGNANNNLFVDSSGAFNPVSRLGNATQGSFTPYSTNWSNYFDGSGDYFTAPYTSANFDWWTSGTDFTIEYWFFANSSTGISYSDAGINHSTVVGNRSATSTTDYWSFGPTSAGTVTFYYYNGGGNGVTSTATYSLNTWNHVAMTKTSSGITIFVNGVAGTTTAISGTPQSSTGVPLTVGQGNNSSFNGYVSNLRIVRGTAIYSGNFTVPTAPLTAVTNTTLLTCQSNRFRDASINNLTLTVTGNTSVTDFGPFSSSTYAPIAYNQSDITNWSGYFDGTGDNLTIPSNAAFGFGTGDFTIEFWAYIPTWTSDAQLIGCHTAFVGFDWLIQQFSSGQFRWLDASLTLQSGAVPVTNQWNHYAVTRSGTTLRIFLNGTQTASGTSTANIPATRALGIMGDTGASATQIGYMSNVRIVKGTAVYTSNFTPPTTNLTAISGTSLLTLQNAAFTDNSTNNFVITPNGNPTVTGNSPFNTVGYWSNNFPTTNNGSDNLNFGTNAGLSFTAADDLTVEAWVQLTAHNTYSVICSKGNANTREWSVNINSTTMYFYWSTNGSSSGDSSVTASFSFQIGTLYHIAACKSGSSVRLFVNGTQIGSTGTFTSIYNGSGPFRIATFMDFTGISHCFAGYISNLRVVKGTALYTSNFTVPTGPLTAVSGTSLLTCQNGRFIDNSTNNLTATVSGVPSVQSYNPFYTATIASNGGSMYFDGSGDYLQSNQPNYALGSGDWTVDFWFYAQSNWAATTYDQVVGTLGTDASTGGWRIGSNFAGNGRTLWFTFTNGSYNDIWASANISDGAWHHIAVVRQSGTVRLYRDGVQTASGACTVNFTKTNLLVARSEQSGASGETQCMVSNLRVIKGTCLYPSGTTFTPPTSVQNPTSATVLALNGMNAGIYDATAINDMETVGNAQVSTVQSKFGGSSVYFDGTGDWLDIPSNPTLDFGTGDITIECWLYVTSVATTYQSICQFGDAAGTAGFHILTNTNTICLRTNNSQPLTTSGTITANTWNHIALTRANGTTRLFINGTTSGGTYNWTASLSSGSTRRIGADIYGNPVNGYIDDFRVTRGVARYTANFTPPTQAFPVY